MNLLIVTGLSGAGKSLAVNALEDIGFFCIDNLPAALLPRLVDFALRGESQLKRVAVVLDARGLRSVEQVEKALAYLENRNIEYEILFLDADDKVILQRYKATRRIHPLVVANGITLQQAIQQERSVLQPLRSRAKYIIDTSLLSTAQNRERVLALFLKEGQNPMSLTILSFGFKYGLPTEADIVLDVRCLPNPFYVPELKELTGLEPCVSDYVLSTPESRELLECYRAMLRTSLPLYVKEGKNQLTVAVGCTGGKHRSIAIACLLGSYCQELGYAPVVQHRDISRG